MNKAGKEFKKHLEKGMKKQVGSYLNYLHRIWLKTKDSDSPLLLNFWSTSLLSKAPSWAGPSDWIHFIHISHKSSIWLFKSKVIRI